MKFEIQRFSKKYPAVEVATIVYHEPPRMLRVGWGATPVDTQYRSTAAALVAADGRVWIGVTACSSSDPFVKAVGRAKAIGRAYQAMALGQPPEIFDLSQDKIIGKIVDRLKVRIEDWKREITAR